MLAAMSTAALPPSSQATAVSRDRGDACPGTLRLHGADDGALARIRVPGGVLTTAQAEALADAAQRFGDGRLHLTSRGNVQVRGLADECGAELAELLTGAGLLPSRGHERVRNIVASPLSGLDGHGLCDVRPWLIGLDALLCANEAARELSGRFLFALDDGRGDVARLDPDVTVRATPDGGALLGLGPGDAAVRVAAVHAARAAMTAAETFLDEVRASGNHVWRVAELGPAQDRLTHRLHARLTAAGIAFDERGRDGGRADGPPPGIVGAALSVHVPLGSFSPHQWRELVRTAPDELRLTPWRGVVVPMRGAIPDRLTDALARLTATGLVGDPASPWPRVGACIGRPGCAKSHADVRLDAARGLEAADGGGLPLYWSGCERRCGHPRGDRIDVVAGPDGRYRLSTAAAGREPRTVTMDDPSRLAAALAAITS
ncbi:precorrin-3B synthase [Streptomyces sp. NPDC056061]|uniref:precorrin-3B synthase n=1 Tax=Streptomyces sp. NPDC056061 TaxID=3345700 RepID=UPI0035DFB3A0